MSTPPQPQPESPPASKQFPWNRVVAFLGPVVAIIAGALAAWLVQHFPGLHLNQGTTTAEITQAIEFAIAAAGAYALQHKWLTGWQQWEALTTPPAAKQSPMPSLPIDTSVAYPGLALISPADMLYPPDAFPLQPPLDAPPGSVSDPVLAPEADQEFASTSDQPVAIPIDPSGVEPPEGAGQAGDGE